MADNEWLKAIQNEYIKENLDIRELSPLVLAYIGDAVYEVYVRVKLLSKPSQTVHTLHKQSITYVKAKAQAQILHRIMDKLTEKEQDIVRRGRNTKSATVPKNADLVEYRYATGFEALIGYLFLKKDTDRLTKILEMVFDTGKNQE